MLEQEDHLTICTICKDDTASKAGLTESYLSDTHFAFLQPSDFVTLPTGEVKRRRQKGSYKDIYLERKGYVDVVVRGKLTNTEKERAFVTNPLTQSLNCDDFNLLKISSASNTNNKINTKIGTHYIRDPSFKGHIHDNNIKIINNYKEESSIEKEINEHNNNIEEEKEHFNHSHTVNLESENDNIYVINKTLVPTTDLGQFITKGNAINKRYISLDAFKKDPKENNTVKRHNTPTQQQNDNSIQHNSNNSSIAKNNNNIIIEHVDRKDKDKTARPKANIPKPKNTSSQRHIVKSSSTGALHNKNKYTNNSNINDSKVQDISNRKLKNSKSSNNILSNKNQPNSYSNKKQATIKSNQPTQHRNKETNTHKPSSQIQSQSQNNINNNEITTDIVNQQTDLKKETFGCDNSLKEQSLGDNIKITNKDENINQIEQFSTNQCNKQNQKVFENNEDFDSNQLKSSSNRNNRIKESKAKPKSKSCNNKDHDSTLKNNANNKKENTMKLSSTSSKAASVSKIQKPKSNIDNKNNYTNQQQQQSNICNNSNKINELQQNEQNNNDNININNFIDNTISPIKATPINSHKISKENKEDFVNFEESINNKNNQDNLQNIASNNSNHNQVQKELLAKLHSLRSNNISNGIPLNQDINANNNINNNNVSDNENNIKNLIINQQQDILNDNNNELFYESKRDLINQRLTHLKSKTENLRSSSIKKQQNNSLEMLEDLIKDKENSFNNEQNKQNIIHQDYKQNIDNLNSNNKPHFAESGLLKKLSLTPSSIPEIPNSGELHYMNSAQQLEDEIDKQNNNYIPFPKDIFNIKASKVKEANQININTNSIRDLLYYKGNPSHNTILANYPNSLVNPKSNELVQRNERINDKLAETKKQILDDYAIENSSGVNKHFKKKSIEDIANTNSKWLGVNTNELLGIKDISTDPKSKELKNKFNQLKRDNEIKKKKTELNIQQNVLSSSTFSFKDSLMNHNNNINNINHIPRILHQSQSATNVYGTLDHEHATKRKTYKDFDDLKYKTIIRNSHSLNHQELNTDKQNNKFVDYQTFLANQKQNTIFEEESNFHLNKVKNDLKDYNTNYKTKLPQNKIILKKENLIDFSIPNGMHHSNSALNINYSYINNKLTKCYNNNNNNNNNVTNNIILINGKGSIMPPNAIDKGVFQYFK